MEVVRQEDIEAQDATNAPLFYGGKVTRKPLVGDPKTDQYSFALVSFTTEQRIISTHIRVIRSCLLQRALE